MAFANLSESNSTDFRVLNDRISVNDVDYLVGTDFDDGAFHTFRIAHDAVDNELFFWADGNLLNADLSTALNGNNGSGFDNSTFIGHYSGSHGGEWGLDYIRIDESALGLTAIPEPSSTALLGLGGLALILRRRK
jgi:hypothetical protein